MMTTSSCITHTAEIKLDDRGFLYIKILPDSCIDEEDALDNLLVIKNMSKNTKLLKLIDLRGEWTITKKAKQVSIKNVSPETTIARAYITNSYFSKVLHDFFDSFGRQGIPQKFFTSEQKAIEWLLTKKQ